MVLVIAAGQTTGTFTLTITADKTDEANETIIVGITSVSAGASIGDGTGVITILDDD